MGTGLEGPLLRPQEARCLVFRGPGGWPDPWSLSSLSWPYSHFGQDLHLSGRSSKRFVFGSWKNWKNSEMYIFWLVLEVGVGWMGVGVGFGLGWVWGW